MRFHILISLPHGNINKQASVEMGGMSTMLLLSFYNLVLQQCLIHNYNGSISHGGSMHTSPDPRIASFFEGGGEQSISMYLNIKWSGFPPKDLSQ